MFILMRALTYAAHFMGVLLLLLPSRVLDKAGIAFPGAFGREYEDYCQRVHRWRPRCR